MIPKVFWTGLGWTGGSEYLELAEVSFVHYLAPILLYYSVALI